MALLPPSHGKGNVQPAGVSLNSARFLSNEWGPPHRDWFTCGKLTIDLAYLSFKEYDLLSVHKIHRASVFPSSRLHRILHQNGIPKGGLRGFPDVFFQNTNELRDRLTVLYVKLLLLIFPIGPELLF